VEIHNFSHVVGKIQGVKIFRRWIFRRNMGILGSRILCENSETAEFVKKK
jgi:hypothetical protein